MNDSEKIQSFGDMVEATQKMNRPWIIFCGLLLAALILSNALWAFVHFKQIQYAYMTPETFSQTQDYENMTQEQNHEQGATFGD